METIEVFKTNVNNISQAAEVIELLLLAHPGYRINIDLEDTDRILRIESKSNAVNTDSVIKLLKNRNYNCEILN